MVPEEIYVTIEGFRSAEGIFPFLIQHQDLCKIIRKNFQDVVLWISLRKLIGINKDISQKRYNEFLQWLKEQDAKIEKSKY